MTYVLLALLLVLVVGGGIYFARSSAAKKQKSLDDSMADARRWVERLGGQVLTLNGTNGAAEQAIADASERYTAAGSQIDQAATSTQASLAKDTALEGLYYVRAARLAMGLDPGPDLPVDSERERAGKVTEKRSVDVEGEHYEASPDPDDRTPHYYPGGRVAGRPVPQGWYNTPWWQPALVAGAWTIGSMFLFSAMFSGMAGIASAGAWESGQDAGQEESGGEGGDGGDGGEGGDGGGDGGGDYGGDGGGDYGGGDYGGGGGDYGGGSDFGGGGDFGGGFDF